jgi:hypothetical protein
MLLMIITKHFQYYSLRSIGWGAPPRTIRRSHFSFHLTVNKTVNGSIHNPDTLTYKISILKKAENWGAPPPGTFDGQTVVSASAAFVSLVVVATKQEATVD